MRLDTQLTFCENQTLTVSADSTNVLDLAGTGLAETPAYAVVASTGATTAVVTAVLWTSENNTDDWIQAGSCALPVSTDPSVGVIPLPPGLGRYMKLNFQLPAVPAPTAPTEGKAAAPAADPAAVATVSAYITLAAPSPKGIEQYAAVA